MSTILVVDDEPAILEVVVEFARTLGHDAVGACDGEEALAIVQSRLPDLVITDVMMPRLNGLGLYDALRATERLREVPILFMSAVHAPALPKGAAFVRKPFDLDELEAGIARALDGRAIEVAPPTPVDRNRDLDVVQRLVERARRALELDSVDEARAALDEVEHVLRRIRAPS